MAGGPTTRGLGFSDPEQKADLKGRVGRVIYYNEENLYCVLTLETEEGEVTATGNLGRVRPGERLVLKGRFAVHPKYGRRFVTDSFKVIPPKEEEGMKAYLGSGLIKGIGPVMAQRIVDRFGAQTLEVMDSEPDRLLEVEGIGKAKLKQINKARSQRKELEGLGLLLRSHDLPASLAVRLYKRYGDRALALVRANPYLLIRDMPGIGFKRADTIAQSLGLGPDSQQRLAAGLFHLLTEAADRGDCFLFRDELLDRTARLLGIGRGTLGPVLADLAQAGRVKEEEAGRPAQPGGPAGRVVFLPWLHQAEESVAKGLLDLMKRPGPLAGVDPRPVLGRIARGSELRFSAEQEQALKSVFDSKVLIITGGPGTGKTTLIRALVALFRSQGIAPALAAPTGRAAKRLSQSAGEEASTIHRLLEYAPQEGFQRNRENRLSQKAVFIDELSMVDIRLMASLVEALGPETSLVLIGDSDQLPAVGPGKVLEDLIGSDKFGVVRLKKVFRQSRGSLIIANAHRIRQGRPGLEQDGDDFYFIAQEDSQKAAEIVIRLVEERIPARFGFDPLREIQVLSPMRKGVCGVEALNRDLRQALNPLGRELGNTGYRIGDKVIQTRNNYERMTFNGDLGLIQGEAGKNQLLIDMEGETKTYEGEGLDELALAYCLSIHKSQGSEYPAVVIPLLPEHTIMLRRNLIYTALTRARRLAIIVGSPGALRGAVSRARGDNRRTLLAQRIREGLN